MSASQSRDKPGIIARYLHFVNSHWNRQSDNLVEVERRAGGYLDKRLADEPAQDGSRIKQLHGSAIDWVGYRRAGEGLVRRDEFGPLRHGDSQIEAIVGALLDFKSDRLSRPDMRSATDGPNRHALDHQHGYFCICFSELPPTRLYPQDIGALDEHQIRPGKDFRGRETPRRR